MVSLATGIDARVIESGDTDGEPLVMLHGWGASVYTFRHAMTLFPARGFRAIAVDLRGYGLSDHPRARGSFTLTTYIADLVSLLDALSIRRAVLLGHSMGGGIALHLALRDPSRVRALALVNPAGLVEIPIVRMARASPRAVIERLCDTRIPRWLVAQILRRLAFSNADCLTERDVDEYWSPTRFRGYVHAVRGAIDEFGWQPLSTRQARELAVRTVVILGEHDRLIREARGAADGLRGATVVEVPGGHCVHEESPEAVYGRIGDFIGR